MTTARADLKLMVTAGECNGFMHSAWWINDQLALELALSDSGPHCLEFELELPCVLRIVLSGKDPETDTWVNSKGQILHDKFIRIDQMWLARHPVPDHLFMKIIQLNTATGQTYHGGFLAFNGEARLTLAENDAIIWHMRHNHYQVS